MAGPDPHGDQRIEELLSQLQGIFSKLSTSDQAESQEKENLPASSSGTPAPALIEHLSEADAAVPVPLPVPTPAPVPVPPPVSMEPPPAQPAAPTPTPAPVADIPELPPAPAPAAPVFEPATAHTEVSPASPATPPAMDDDTTIRVAICYPEENENELKTLSQKLETLTPKFTKVSFKLAVRMVTSYKPKATDWSEEFFAQAQAQRIRAYFFIVPRPMEEAKRKALAATLEKFGIYYQEVPLVSIEKRAFYMDLLLGLVFFFDSHGLSPKPPTEGA